MNGNEVLSRVGASTVALMLVLSVMAAGAAAIAWDAETTTTPSTSDADGTGLTQSYDAQNNTLYLETDGASTSNLTLEIQARGTNATLYTNSTPDTVNASNGHYAFNVSHSAFDDLPRGADAGHYDIVIKNDTGSVLLTDDYTLTYANNDEAVLVVADSTAPAIDELADTVSVTQKTGFLSGLFGNSSTNVASFSGYVQTDSNHTEKVILQDSETAAAFDDVASSTDSGAWMQDTQAYVNGVPVQIYHDAPSSAPDHPYMVYDDTTDTLTLRNKNVSDDLSTAQNIRISGTAHKELGFWEVANTLGYGEAFKLLG